MANYGNSLVPPQIDFSGQVRDLITQYRTSQALRKKQELDTARKNTLAKVMQGGDVNEGIKGLMGIGDTEGALTLAKAYKTIQPAQAKPMTEFQQWQVLHGQAQDAQSEFQKRAAATPQSTKEYWQAYPDKSPQWYREGLSLGGGDQGMPQPVSATETSNPSKWQPTPEQYKLIQSGKMMRPEDAAKHVSLVNASLEQTKQAAQKLLDNPDLPKAVGGAASMLQRPPGNTFWERATAMWPGTGAYLSSTDEHGKIVPSPLMGGTSVADAQAAINSLKDQISLAVIANMKEASGRAGNTGLGRVMQIEYAGWQNALGSLDPHQTPEKFRKNLQNIVTYIGDSQKRINDALANDYGGTQSQAAPSQEKSGWTQPVQVPPEYQNLAPIPGATKITTDPNGAYLPDRTAAPVDPKQMNDQQRIGLARQLAQSGMNKDQIIQWFAGRGVNLEP